MGMASMAHGSAAVLLEQPYGKLNIFFPTGHAAIYLDHVCAETPLKLRVCRADEQGAVLSRYDGIGGYDWIAMPLIPYLYSVQTAAEIPQSIDRAGEERLREAYRERYLQSVAPNWLDGSSPRGNWYELVGSAYDRKIYGFQVTTTREQDARLIAAFNDRKNVQTYSGFDSNCADFARNTMNLLYPHMVRRNYVADLGMSSPKSVARSLSHRASKNPEMHFEVFVIPQVAGSLPRSHSPQNLAEGILKRYPVPLVIFSPVSLGVAFAAYVGQGRFSMPKDAQRLDVSDIGVKPSVLVEPGGGGPGGLAGNSNRIARPFPEQALTLPPPSSTLVLSVVKTTARVPAETMTANSAGSRALVRVGVLQ
jgi:hypothetical protein